MRLVSKKDFVKECRQVAQQLPFQGSDYFNQHVDRLYDTFVILRTLVEQVQCKKILSLGAGSAYVELIVKKMYPWIDSDRF